MHSKLQFQGAVQVTAGVLASANTGELLAHGPSWHKADETPAFLGTEAWT